MTRGPAVLAALLFGALAAPAAAAPGAHGMIAHAVFFSLRAKLPAVVDPQVFVLDLDARAASGGPDGIGHPAGFRPAMPTDDPAARLSSADGTPLDVTAGGWFAARGTLTLDPALPEPPVSASFSGLIPGGLYSLFEETFGATGSPAAAPLDGTGAANTFTADADGNASVTLTVPRRLTGADAIALIYHSDHQAHGLAPGRPGIVSHEQLIYRVP